LHCQVKQFASQLLASLDDDDEVGLVTFGEDAEVFFPLEKLTAKSRVRNSAFPHDNSLVAVTSL
jgi:hypothetical protein